MHADMSFDNFLNMLALDGANGEDANREKEGSNSIAMICTKNCFIFIYSWIVPNASIASNPQ
jgi:hypothetical protein